MNKVLMIFSNSYEGHYARDLAHGFNQNGIEIAFVSLNGAAQPSWVRDFQARDFSSRFQKSNHIVWKTVVLYKLIREYKPDILQTHLFMAGILWLLSGRLASTPVVHTRHHIDEHYQSGTFVHRWLDRTVARKSKHVVVCSKAAKKWLVEIEGISDSHVTVINQGFDFSYLQPNAEAIATATKELEFSEENLNIICVARYSRAKGQDYLLYAISELVQTVPNLSLTFMGPGDSSWLDTLIHELKLGETVKVLPSRKDVPACIAAADMIVHPSLADSFSQLVIEAQAVGGLLIATDIAAAREQIVDGVTGVIVPPRDSKSIVQAILGLISKPELSSSMRQNGPTHVREKFTWQRMVDEEISCLIANM